MKSLLQKRAAAILLCCLLLPASLLLNTRAKLGREADRVSAKLYTDSANGAAAVLATVRSGVSALGAISDQAEIDSAVQEIDQALALLGGGASIATQLSAACEALDVSIALAKLHSIAYSEAQGAVEALRSALSARAGATVLRERYQQAREAGDTLLTALGAAALSETEREQLAECSQLLQKLGSEIAGNAYNQAVYSFLRENGSGWTRLCAQLAGVEYPVLFG